MQLCLLFTYDTRFLLLTRAFPRLPTHPRSLTIMGITTIARRPG